MTTFYSSYSSKERVEFIRNLPCLICGKRPSENAHVKSRGAGGNSTDVVPLCREHHQQQHDMGILTFQKEHNINLKNEAEKLKEFLNE